MLLIVAHIIQNIIVAQTAARKTFATDRDRFLDPLARFHNHDTKSSNPALETAGRTPNSKGEKPRSCQCKDQPKNKKNAPADKRAHAAMKSEIQASLVHM